MTAEKQALIMRAEKAEARIKAAETELLKQSKRFAQQLAQLRIQLAEKTATTEAGALAMKLPLGDVRGRELR